MNKTLGYRYLIRTGILLSYSSTIQSYIITSYVLSEQHSSDFLTSHITITSLANYILPISLPILCTYSFTYALPIFKLSSTHPLNRYITYPSIYVLPILNLSSTYPLSIPFLSLTYTLPTFHISLAYPPPIPNLSYTYLLPILYLYYYITNTQDNTNEGNIYTAKPS